MLRNLLLYRIFLVCNDPGFGWPVKFLLELQYLSLQQVLLLQAIYQITNVACEVPSGFVSDRFGRKRTLVVSAIFQVASLAFFATGTTFFGFLMANLLAGVSVAMESGTDRSLHYDSLESLGMQSEFQSRDANAQKIGMFLQALFSMIGGAVGAYDYHYACVLATATAVIALVTAVLFKEPPQHSPATETALLRHFSSTVAHLKNPIVAWVLAFAAFVSILDYIPYQYYQPYLDLLSLRGPLGNDMTSVSAGLVSAATMAIGAVSVGFTPRLLKSYAPATLWLGSAWVIFVIIFLASWILHPIIAALFILRHIPDSFKNGILAPVLLPHLPRNARATVLSFVAMGSRLAIALTFLGLALIKSESRFDEISLQMMAAGAGCLAIWIALAVTTPRGR